MGSYCYEVFGFVCLLKPAPCGAGCSISSGLGEQVQPTAQGRFDLVFCKEVLVWFWSDNPWPSFEVVFFEEITRVARGEFDFFKLWLSERDEARFAVGGVHG